MLVAIGSLAVIGVVLGTVLAISARFFAVEENPLEVELLGILPGAQCGQCGYVGCGQAAAALAKGEAPVTLCPPGGKSVVEKLAQRLGVTADLSEHEEKGPEVAFIHEDLCIGCLRCLQACSTDAIIGGPKQLHTVMPDACHACAKCFKICPTEAIEMRPVAVTIGGWHWQKPDADPAHAKPAPSSSAH